MTNHAIFSITQRIVILALIVFVVSTGFIPTAAHAAALDYDIAGGHFYTQAAGPGAPSGSGYAITNEGTDKWGQPIHFWSEFQRLGGVNTLGYPSSRRFVWNGYISQATQRVVLQWRPEAKTVYFVNVMDLITGAGKDDWLLAYRQTPKPYNFKTEEQNLSFNQIVAKRYALLDNYPAIKAAFFGVSDPLQLNGLPTTPVTDMGDAYVLRAQRKIFQQWKKDMPWAKAGTVTVALGGDIAKEAGLIQAQDAQAVIPMTPNSGNSGGDTQYLNYNNSQYSFSIQYPQKWIRVNNGGSNGPASIVVAFVTPDTASSAYPTTFNVVVQDFDFLPITMEILTSGYVDGIKESLTDVVITEQGPTTLGGLPAYKLAYSGTFPGKGKIQGVAVWTLKEKKAYALSFVGSIDKADNFSPHLANAQTMISSFQFK